MTRTAGNLILMTLICVVIFIAVMAVRPAPAAELSRRGVRARDAGACGALVSTNK